MLSLATLVAPLRVDEFLATHWPHRPYVSDQGRDRLAWLEGVPELASGERALAGARYVGVFRPDGGVGRVADAAAALPLYRLGLTCTFGGRHIPALRDATARITADLGLPEGSVAPEVFCCSTASGARMHSDHDVNFSVLVRGTKHWRIAENHHIRNQTEICLAGSVPQRSPEQLALADRTPFPDQMPDDAATIDAGPGGLVFLPRGWWHETVTDGEALQVNFVVNRPDWMSVLTRALKERLVPDVAWRAYAFDLFGPPERRAVAVAEFDRLVRQLVDDLAGTDRATLAAELLAAAGYDAVNRDPAP